MSRLLVAQRALTVPGWAKDALWRNAQAIPSLDLRFADNKSLVDAATGASLITFTRASSGTFVGSDGVLRTAATDVPRFDHNPTTGESLGLLVKEPRTNLALYSQAINVANWGFSQATTQTLNAATSPDGNSNATLFAENTQNANRFIAQTIAVTNAAYTVSIFAKAKERRRIMFRESSVSGTSATFDLQSGTVVGSEGSPITSIQPFRDGWYRCVMTYTPSSASTRTHSVYLMPDSGTSFATSTYTGDGTSGVFLFGFVVEAGALPSSYIPTTTAAVTRSADVASITGTAFSGWYRQDEGTVYGEGITNDSTASAFPLLFQISDATASNRIQATRNNATGNARLAVIAGGVVQAATDSTTWTLETRTRLGLGYATDNFALSANGGPAATDSLGTVPSVTRLTLGQDLNIANILNGTIRRLTYWPQRLPNSTLQSLTQ